MSPAGFVVSWVGAGDETNNGVFARLFDAASNPVTDDLHVQTGPLAAPSPLASDVAMSAKGDFVVVWEDQGATTYSVSGRRWNSRPAPRRVLPFRSARGRSMRAILG